MPTHALAVASNPDPTPETPARTLARRAFWSEHPLCALYAIARGYWTGDGQFHMSQQWSLRQLIDFAESLPEGVIRNLSGANNS
jgi:hypothetical protein